jgi:salicylate hydroxylase
MGEYDVVIAGAGLGGLCAAVGLRRAGLRVLVLERDANLASRPQGYRININLAGDAALRACLPSRISSSTAIRLTARSTLR